MGSKRPDLLTLSAAVAALAIGSASGAEALERPAGGGPRINLPSHSHLFSWERGHGFKRGFPIFIVQREPVIIEREVVVREVAAAVPPPPPPPPPARKPYVIGKSYASLPSGCMKLIEGGVSYYLCSGEWYRQVGSGSGLRYVAVARKL